MCVYIRICIFSSIYHIYMYRTQTDVETGVQHPKKLRAWKRMSDEPVCGNSRVDSQGFFVHQF